MLGYAQKQHFKRSFKKCCEEIQFWTAFVACIACGVFAYHEVVQEYAAGKHPFWSWYWFGFNILTAWVIKFEWDYSGWSRIVFNVVQFAFCELCVVLSMIRLWLAVGSSFNNRDIPNILVIVITFMLFLLHTMMNTANHLMLICFKASPEKFINIRKHTDNMRSILMSTCIVMIIFDFFIPIWQLDTLEYITLHSLIFISGYCNYLLSVLREAVCAITKRIEMLGNKEIWFLLYCYAWGLLASRRDMIVATFSESMWNLDYTKFKKLEKDGKIRRSCRDGEDVLLYFWYNACIALFLEVRDYYLAYFQIPLNPAILEPIVKETNDQSSIV